MFAVRVQVSRKFNSGWDAFEANNRHESQLVLSTVSTGEPVFARSRRFLLPSGLCDSGTRIHNRGIAGKRLASITAGSISITQ